jgi:Flp pilus assembly protein TadG
MSRNRPSSESSAAVSVNDSAILVNQYVRAKLYSAYVAMLRPTQLPATELEAAPSSPSEPLKRERRFMTRRRRLFSGLDESGATFIEFAIVGPPLLLLMLTILDLGVMLTTQSLLDGAARDAARLIRTGQVQSQSNPKTTFQNLLCSDMSPMMSVATCQSQVVFDVQVFSDFGSVSFTPCTQDTDSTQAGYCSFSAGIADQIVGVQVTYNRSFMVPWVGACLSGGSCWFGLGTTDGSNPGTDSVPLVSTVIFQNEPFPSS